MRRRILGIVLAVVLALVGTLALVRYVQSAKDEAIKDEEQVEVLVVQSDLRQGAPLNEVSSNVKLVEVPRRLLAPGALADLTLVESDFVTAAELKQGDQILASRFVDPVSLVTVDVPEGLQEITLALSPERAVGAGLNAGDTVGVLFSFEPFELNTSGTPAEPAIEVDPALATSTTIAPTRTPNTTHFTLHKILVTAVQFSREDSQRASEIQTGDSADSTDTTLAPAVAEAPSNQVLVTLAISAPEAEQLVFASEFGTIWLTLENADASEEGTRILTLGQVYISVPR